MDPAVRTVIYPVSDVDATRELFRAFLGVDPFSDEEYYIGFRVGDQEVGLDPHGHEEGMTGPISYWHVADIREALRHLIDAGAEGRMAVRDIGGGKLVAQVTDADGNIIGLVQEG